LTGIPEDQLDSSPRDSPATDPSGAPGLKEVGKERDDVEAGGQKNLSKRTGYRAAP
jgi:hypothetical protein